MKTILHSIYATIFIIALAMPTILLAQKPKFPETHLNVVGTYNLEKALIIIGKPIIEITQAHELVIAVPNGKDGALFFLENEQQPDNNIKALLALTGKKTEFIYYGEALIINPLNTNGYYALYVRQNEFETLKAEVLHTTTQPLLGTWTGYGLGKAPLRQKVKKGFTKPVNSIQAIMETLQD